MADKKISELDALTGAAVATDDQLIIVDTSAGLTKNITIDEFKDALDTSTGFVRITGDTMTGALDVQSTITADGLTVEKAGASQIVADFSSTGANAYVQLNDSNSTNFAGLGVTTDTLSLWSLNKRRINIASGGDISFYEDTGTTPKFFWDASAESLGIGTSSPSSQIHISSSSGATLRLERDDTTITSGNIYGNILFTGNDASSGASGTRASILVLGEGTEGQAALTFKTAGSGTAAEERLRIDSSGNVGIGTSSPDAPLVVEESAVSQTAQGNDFAVFKRNADGYLKIYSGNTNIGGIAFGDPDDPFIGAIRYQHSTDHLDFYVNNSERMRIDSSGNLLVGKTSADLTTTGIQLNNGGFISASRPDVSGVFNRRTTDGEIVQFRKDGSTVGSIGVTSSRLTIGGGDTGLRFVQDYDEITPWNPSTNGVRDAAIDLGSSANRFKDLYLSGGVTGGNATNPARFSHSKDDYITLADDATLNLHDSVAGSLIISVYDRVGGRGGVFHATFTGAVTQIAANGPWATSDTDGSYCVYKSTGSHAVYFKNRIGSSGTFQVSIFAAEC